MKSKSRWQSFRYAWSGLVHVLRHEWNVRIELAAAMAVIAAGVYLQIGTIEWAILFLTIGSVIAAEFANTVAETLVDIASPDKSEPARIAKDVAAGGVLVTALTSIIVGVLILGLPLARQLMG